MRRSFRLPDLMFESRQEDGLPLRLFLRRMLFCLLIAGLLVAFALGLGMVGYHFLARLAWVDALLNAR